MKYLAPPLILAFSLAGATAHAEIRLNLEAPMENDIDSGIINVMGWATDDRPGVGIRSVLMQVDDRPAREIAHGADRGDVAAAFPDDEDALKSGFAATLSTRLLGNGPHRITVTVTNDLGESRSDSNLFHVSNPPRGNAERWWDEIDLEGATARISGQRIFLDGVTINGRVYDNVGLAFDRRSSGFQLVDWVDDRDGDGYKDDDRDHDGYHDDDLDRDGYSDDDHDRDGLHDDEECTAGMDPKGDGNCGDGREHDDGNRDDDHGDDQDGGS